MTSGQRSKLTAILVEQSPTEMPFAWVGIARLCMASPQSEFCNGGGNPNDVCIALESVRKLNSRVDSMGYVPTALLQVRVTGRRLIANRTLPAASRPRRKSRTTDDVPLHCV